jgi:hypothetical protein
MYVPPSGARMVWLYKYLHSYTYVRTHPHISLRCTHIYFGTVYPSVDRFVLSKSVNFFTNQIITKPDR